MGKRCVKYFSGPPLLFSSFVSLSPLLPSLVDGAGGPVDSPVQWKRAFIGPLCSALPEANGIQMWPQHCSDSGHLWSERGKCVCVCVG